MAGRKQHVDLQRKLSLRQHLLARAASGAAYVPFVGDGDIAAELYFDRVVWAADVDEARTANARAVLGEASRVEVADCDESWPFGADLPPEAFAVADFDADAYPYDAFRRFWEHAPKTDRLVLFFTDGQRQGIRRGGKGNALRLPDGTKQALFGDKAQRSTQARAVFNLYWARHVEPWIKAFMAAEGWTVVETSKYLRDSMLYWGVVVERSGKGGKSAGSTKSPAAPQRAVRKGVRKRFDAEARALVLASIVEDRATIAEAAAVAGFTARTVDRTAKADPEFGEALARAVRERGDLVAPGKFDEDRREAYLAALREGKRRMKAARIVDVDPKTVSKYVAEHPEFEQEIRAAESEADELVEDALFEAAKSGNVVACQVWLYNRSGGKWQDRRKVPTFSPTGDGAGNDSIPEATPEDWLADLLVKSPEAAELLERLEALAADLQTASASTAAS